MRDGKCWALCYSSCAHQDELQYSLVLLQQSLRLLQRSWRRKETSNHRLHGLNPITSHWVFQQLLAGADHLFHSHTIFVDFECWNCPHIFSTCNSRAVIHIDLEWRAKWHVNVVQIWCGWPWMVLVTLRKLTDGYLAHSVFTNGEILQHCWFEGVIKWTTETPVNFKQTNKIHQIKKG